MPRLVDGLAPSGPHLDRGPSLARPFAIPVRRRQTPMNPWTGADVTRHAGAISAPAPASPARGMPRASGRVPPRGASSASNLGSTVSPARRRGDSPPTGSPGIAPPGAAPRMAPAALVAGTVRFAAARGGSERDGDSLAAGEHAVRAVRVIGVDLTTFAGGGGCRPAAAGVEGRDAAASGGSSDPIRPGSSCAAARRSAGRRGRTAMSAGAASARSGWRGRGPDGPRSGRTALGPICP